MKNITSDQNENFKRWASLLESKGIKKEGQCLISGRKIFPEILQNHLKSVQEILIFSEEQLEEWNLPSNNVYLLSRPLFQELDVFGTKAPLAVLKTPELGEWNMTAKPQGVELLVALQDPSNVGSLLRSAEAFGVNKVVLLKESAHPFHPKVSKTASGSNLNLKLEKGPSIRDLMMCPDLWVLDKSGDPIHKQKWPPNLRLLIGEEGPGVPAEILETAQVVSIPIQDTLESLNAVVAGSIALFCIGTQI